MKERVAAVNLILGTLGTVAFGGEDILSSGDWDMSQVTPHEQLLTALFM